MVRRTASCGVYDNDRNSRRKKIGGAVTTRRIIPSTKRDNINNSISQINKINPLFFSTDDVHLDFIMYLVFNYN